MRLLPTHVRRLRRPAQATWCVREKVCVYVCECLLRLHVVSNAPTHYALPSLMEAGPGGMVCKRESVHLCVWVLRCELLHVGHSLLQISFKVFSRSLLKGYALLRVSFRVCRSLASLYARVSLTQAGTGDIGGVLTTCLLFVRLCYLIVLFGCTLCFLVCFIWYGWFLDVGCFVWDCSF